MEVLETVPLNVEDRWEKIDEARARHGFPPHDPARVKFNGGEHPQHLCNACKLNIPH
jgi:hypothetical protein